MRPKPKLGCVLTGSGVFFVGGLEPRATCDQPTARAGPAAQDLGIEVLVATPRRNSVAREVAKLADGIVDLTEKQLADMLLPRGST